MVAQRQTQSMRWCPGSLHRPAERTAQPLCLHHPELFVVPSDGHAALIELEQHTDAVALLPRVPPPQLVPSQSGAGKRVPWYVL